MNDGLPRGWATAPLDQLCDRLRGVSYARDEASAEPKEDSLPILRANNIVDDHLIFEDLVYVPSSRVSDRQRIRKGDVVIAMSSGSKNVVGKTAQALEDWYGAFGAFCGVLRSLPELNSRYIGLFLRTRDYRRRISELAAGTNINNLKAEHFSKIEVPLAPLNEQRRIVAKLEKLLGKVDVCQQRLAKIPVLLKRFRQSVLATACSGALTGDWRENDLGKACDLIADIRRERKRLVEEKRARQLTDLEAIAEEDLPLPKPSEWEAIRLDELCSLVTDGKHGDCRNQEGSGYFFLSVKDLKNGELNYDDARQIIEEDFLEVHKRTNLEPLDVLISNSGTIGRIAIAQAEHRTRRTTFQKSVAILKPLRNHVDSRYLGYYLSAVIRYIEGNSQGTAQKNLLLRDLKNLVISLPTRAEQQEIVRRVHALFALADQLGARYAKAKAHVEKLTQSILAKAFRGELVPQDPNDEPASVLLERIKEDRARTVTKSRKYK